EPAGGDDRHLLEAGPRGQSGARIDDVMQAAPAPPPHAAGRRALVAQHESRARNADRPSLTARPWSDCHQITAEVGDRVWSQKFAQPIRHPTLRDAAEVNARSG